MMPRSKMAGFGGGGLRRGGVLVVRQDIGSLQQAKCVALCESHPKPSLAAERAIAAGRTGGQVEVALEPNGAAMATAFVCSLHSKSPVRPEVLSGVIACLPPAASRER